MEMENGERGGLVKVENSKVVRNGEMWFFFFWYISYSWNRHK